jgi:predicted nuclease of restriction endonuclease-like RecB superfamily
VKGLPFRQRGTDVVLNLLGAQDKPWIASIVDEAEAALGQPWHALADRLERIEARTSPARQTALITALRRSLGRRNGRGWIAWKVRQQVLGAPALALGERAARIARAASALEMTTDELEAALWCDLPSERLVTMPRGRPAELALAAAANLDILQRALRRAHHVRVRMWGNPRPVARTAAVRGLLATARSGDGESTLDVSGPLALFHRTTVYGRALGALVPALAWCERFTLDIRCNLGLGEATAHVASPVLLPPAPAPKRYDSALEARLARDLARAAPEWRVQREPAALAAGGDLLFPDFRLEHDSHGTWWLEIVGFWTTDYLEHKLARYRAAGLSNVILCIDAKRAVADDDLPPGARVVRYEHRIDPASILSVIG